MVGNDGVVAVLFNHMPSGAGNKNHVLEAIIFF